MKSTILHGGAEVPLKVGWHPQTPIGTVNLLSRNANTSLTEMVLSCALCEHARVVHSIDMWQWIHVVDVDDSEVVVLLTDLVLQCGHKRPSILASTHITFDAVGMDRRRNLRL